MPRSIWATPQRLLSSAPCMPVLRGSKSIFKMSAPGNTNTTRILFLAVYFLWVMILFPASITSPQNGYIWRTEPFLSVQHNLPNTVNPVHIHGFTSVVLKVGPGPGSSSTKKLDTNANPWAPTQTTCLRLSGGGPRNLCFSSPPGDSGVSSSLRCAGVEELQLCCSFHALLSPGVLD